MHPKQTIRSLGVFFIVLTTAVIFNTISYAVKSISLLKQCGLLFSAVIPKNLLPFPNYTLAAGFIFQIIYGTLLLFCGIGLLRLKKWSRKFLSVILNLSAMLLISRFILFGFMGINIPRLFGQSLYLILIWAFLRSKKIKDFFLLSETERKKEKISNIVLIGILILTILFYALFIKIKISPRLDIFYNPKKIVLTPAKITVDLVERQIGDLKLNLPRDYKNVMFHKNKTQGDFILAFADKNSASKLLVTINTNVFHMLKPVFKSIHNPHGFDNAYELGRKFIREKTGTVLLVIRSLGTDKGRYDEIESDTWRGFMAKMQGKNQLLTYSIFTKQENTPYEIVFFLGDKETSETAKNIVSSLSFTRTSIVDTPALFSQGIEQLKSGSAEEAKYSFINCLLQDYNNPMYHLYLAKAYKETDCIPIAKSHLEEVLRLEPDNTEAKELLSSIETEVKK